MFPDTGDAPGRDPLGIRPRAAVRVLSAEALGSPHTLTMYEAAESVPDALAGYAKAFAARGFTEQRVSGEATGPRAFVKDDASFIVHVSADPKGAFVSVVGLGSAGHVTAAVR
jgi:hypothetical protein